MGNTLSQEGKKKKKTNKKGGRHGVFLHYDCMTLLVLTQAVPVVLTVLRVVEWKE